MSAESLLVAALAPLVTGPVHFNVAPTGSVLPRLVVQQVGGQELQYMEGELADIEQPRMQFASWATSYGAAKALAKSVAAALCSAEGLQCSPLGAAVADYEEDTEMHGFRQDFVVVAKR